MLDTGQWISLQMGQSSGCGQIPRRNLPYSRVKGRDRFTFSLDESPKAERQCWANRAASHGFRGQNHHRGECSRLNDGASAVVIMTEERAASLGLQPLGTIADMAGETDMPFGISWIPALTIRKSSPGRTSILIK